MSIPAKPNDRSSQLPQRLIRPIHKSLLEGPSRTSYPKLGDKEQVPLSPEEKERLRAFEFVDLESHRPRISRDKLEHAYKAFPDKYSMALDLSRHVKHYFSITKHLSELHIALFSKSESNDKPRLTTKTSQRKNRYTDVVPNNAYRVPLSSTPKTLPTTDAHGLFISANNQGLRDTVGYINASDILPPPDIPGLNYSYIACQAPVRESIDDMWQMLWEQHCEMVMFLTPYYERTQNGTIKQKSTPYWPLKRTSEDPQATFLSPVDTSKSKSRLTDLQTPYTIGQSIDEPEIGATAVYGRIRVLVHGVQKIENEIILRHMVMFNCGDPQDPHCEKPYNQRNITIFHYLGWPDFGLPNVESFFKALCVYRTLRARMRLQYSPTAVHCSAGIGRTGTFIAVDMMLDYISEMQRRNESPDIRKVADILFSLRTCRSGMVQTLHQYGFIYHFLQYAYGNPARSRIGLM